MNLQTFELRKLFGRFDVVLTLENNTLILVGENGTGKSTVLGALFYFLTQQWSRLAKVPCESNHAVDDGTLLEVETKSLSELPRRESLYEALRGRMSLSEARHLQAVLAQRPRRHWIAHPDQVADLARRFAVDHEYLEHLIYGRYTEKTELTQSVATITKILDHGLNSQVLFLPTYRRIERDLEYIFREAKIERDTKAFQRRSSESGGYVELVEFGMRDVEEVFVSTMQTIDRDFRADLNRLTGEYLRDVIRHEHYRAKYDDVVTATVPLESLIARIDRILPETERSELVTFVQRIRESGKIEPQDQVVAHFLSMLSRIHGQQQVREARVRKLVDTSNLYLTHKKLVFDDIQFELRFELDTHSSVAEDKRISARDLSSGEKQIVSLFTHIYLSGQKNYFVLIDEPELSISVDWQRRFLSDILNSGHCHGLVAVTHSPFVFSDLLEPYAHSISEFIRNQHAL